MKYFRNRNFSIGFALVSTIAIVAVISLFFTPHDPIAMNLKERFRPPSLSHPMGTDQYGRDILSRIMQGSVNSIIVGVVAVGIGVFFGIILGSIAAHRGGIWDEAIMRLSDMLYGFPAVLSAILITSIFGPGIVNSMVAIGIFNIPIFARLTRATSISVWQREFITAARAGGGGDLRIVIRHVIPNILSSLIVQATVQFAIAILAEAGLSYLGLGTQPPYASWGRMLNEAQSFMAVSPWLAIFPGVAIAWAVMGLNLLGDGLRDILDPKMIRIS